MNQKYSLKTIWIVCSIIGLISNLLGQDVTVTTTSTCTNKNNGEIALQFNASLLDNYSFPFSGEWENTTNGEYGTFTVMSLSNTIPNLDIGHYELTIALNDQCEIFLEVSIGGYPIPAITLISSTCICPDGYGALSVQATGDSDNYGYAWSGTGLSNPNIQNPTVTSTGNYTVTITDSQTGCEATAQTTVTPCSVDLPSIIKVTPECNSAGTSTISIQLPNGYGLAPLQFKWMKVGSGVVETDLSTDGYAALSGAGPGEYCLSLLTMNGCNEQFCGINVTAQPSPNIVALATPITNSSNGAISLNVTGQPGPFTYLWSNGQITPNISGLTFGNYCVTVTDATSNCTNTNCTQLLSCIGLQQSINTIQATVTAIITGGSGGAINITNVQDLFPEYHFNFLWSNGANTEDISGLAPGLYSLRITIDDCPSFIIGGQWEVCAFSLSFSQANTNCNTTTFTVTPSPSGPYTYKWNTNETTQSITANLGAEYCVTVTKVSGCSASACKKPSSSPLTVNLVSITSSINGNPNGSLLVQGTGGILPYSYHWSTGSSSSLITDLYPGPYTVTITDGCGRTATLTQIIQCEFGQSDLQGTVQNVVCSSNTSGAINLTQLPNVGIPNPVFNFKWSNGATTQNIANLSAGHYCVTLTELTTGCYSVKCFDVVTSGDANFIVSFNMAPGCWPLNEGTITAIPSNPSQGPFNYSWNTWDWINSPQSLGNTATINNVPAGWYGVIVTNALGCKASNFTLMWPGQSPFSVAPVQNPVVVCKGQTGSGHIQVTSGSSNGPFTYTWANYSAYPVIPVTTTTNTLFGLKPGNWLVTVTSAHGCQSMTNFSVVESVVKFADIKVDLDCHQGSIQLTPFTGAYSYPPFTYKWSDGPTVKDRTGLAEGNYCVTITNSKGCTATACRVITHPANLKVFTGADVTDSDCSPKCDGSIDINVNQPATYIWSNGATTQDLSKLCTGNYSVTIISANCVEDHSFTIGESGVSSCGPTYQGTSDEFGGSYSYSFKYFQIWAKETCFDADCGLFDQYCSEISVPKGSGYVNKGCWTGTITIAYPAGAPLVLRVEHYSSTSDKLTLVSGGYEWDVPHPGTYEVKVTYKGEGASIGDDCEYIILMNFYGPGNYKDIVGFNGDYWFDMSGIPTNFQNSYFGAWRCEACRSDNPYVLNNNQNDNCEGFGNWLFTYFDYVPSDYSHPCQGGGELTLLDYDSDGNVVFKTINVKPNAFLGELPGMQPFGSNQNTWCTQSGWCLFKEASIYPNGNLNKPILATWSNPASCDQVVWTDPSQPNPSPCTPTSCPEPFVCVNGNCVPPCSPTNPCISGQCINGGCVTQENDCHPECPDGYTCHENDCYLEQPICNFKATVNGGGGESSYKFWHPNIPPGRTLTLKYKTYSIADRITVNGTLVVPCIATGTQLFTTTFPTVGKSTSVVVNTCGSPASKFYIEILCESMMLQEGNTLEERSPNTQIDEVADILVHPNPFASSLGITVRNVEEPFIGTVQLLDNFGKQIESREIDFEPGNNSLTFDSLDKLATGIYFIVVTKEGKDYAYRKVVKVE